MSLSAPGLEGKQPELFPPAAPPRLEVLPDQLTRIRAGGGQYFADFITTEEEAELLVAVDRKAGWMI